MREIKTAFQSFILLLCFLVLEKTYGQVDTSSYSLEYMTDTLVLGAQSKELAATFDDPSRVLYRHVGISTANDQANGIVYHGLPSDFTKWTIHGAEIVNPNHTSNAGTFSDISSQSAGGVLGIPFDVINTFSFHANTHVENTPSTIAGVANFNFLSETDNFFKIGLLGLELSLPTVGLIGQLGVDFGGEKIAFTDGFFQAGLSPNINFIAGGGFSSNVFRGVENFEDAAIGKELTDVDFNSYFYYSGLVYDKKRHKHTLMFSQKKDTRTATSDFFDVFPLAEFENLKLSYAGEIPVFEEDLDNFDVFINANYSDVKHEFPYSQSDGWRSYMLFGLRYLWFNDKYSISAKLGPQIEFQNLEITPEVSFIATRQFNASSLEFSSSLSSQEQGPEIYGIERVLSTSSFVRDPLRNKSFNTAVTYKAEFKQNQKILLRYYYQLLRDVPLNQFGYSPILQTAIFPDGQEVFSFGAAYNYGFEIMFDQLFENGLYFNINLTLFDLEHDGDNVEVYAATENLSDGLEATNNFNYISNVNLSKSWKLTKERSLTANVAFHLRGGAYDYFDYTAPVQLRPYHRLDARIQYDFKKSILALDIQNVLNRKNDGFYFYDELLQERVLKEQLGLIPVLSWKRNF